jgi:hypothetical protein
VNLARPETGKQGRVLARRACSLCSGINVGGGGDR